MERYSINKSEVLNRLRKYEWSTRNTASRPSRLWDLAPKQSGEVIQSDRTVAKKERTPPPPCGGHRRPAEPACEHTGRGRELEPDKEAK